MTSKNCDQWALYEEPGSSESANLCNGGEFDGEHYAPCPQRLSCRVATAKNDSTTSTSSFHGNTGRRVLASTGGLNRGRSLPVMPSGQRGPNRHAGSPLKPMGNSTESFRERIARKQQENEKARQGRFRHHGTTVVPGEHAAQGPHVESETSPVFMPDNLDGIFTRWGKNIVQGAMFATGQQIADYTKHVDVFGTTVRRRLKKPE